MLRLERWNAPCSLVPVVATGLLLWSTFCSISRPNACRHVTIPLAAAFTIIATLNARNFSSNDVINSIFARFVIIYFSHSLFILGFVSSSELEDERKRWLITRSMTPRGARGTVIGDQKAPNNMSGSSDYIFSYKVLLNPLCFGTKWEVALREARAGGGDSLATSFAYKSRKITSASDLKQPSFPSELRDKTLQKPKSRPMFILRRLFALFCRYLALCIYFDRDLFFWMPGGIAENRDDYVLRGNHFFFKSLPCLLVGQCSNDAYMHAVRATVLRLHWVLIQVVPDYLTLSSYHDVLAIIGVATGFDDPSEWPPMYGSITEAYTVRRFWSSFWHLLIYRSFSAFSRSILSILGISRRHPISRYTHNIFVFFLSGIMHEIVPWLLTPDQCIKCGCHHQIWRFVLQVFGMMVEGAVQFVWGKLERWLFGPGVVQVRLYVAMKRCLGYLWVLFWLMWVAEQTYLPFTYCLAS
uniref:Wax synthase domain-containing protein n=1 Tax=Bionectria ochroleuca TaxID=29856 RepID=A0A8H7TQH3_BIOOC